jgi:DNA-binding CsgD family transcriptional regulator/Flp pilus assembly protein TadD
MYRGYYGEYDQALALAHECLHLTEEIEHVQWNCLAHNLLGWLYLDLYALDAAQNESELALSLARQMGSSLFVYCTSEALAKAHIAQNDLQRAEAVLNAALGANPFDNITYTKRLSIAALGELAMAKGDAARALEIADALVGSATNLTQFTVIPRLWLLRGSALGQLKRFDEAEGVLVAARTATNARGLRPMLWRIHRALGKSYQDQDRRKEADTEYSAARSIVQGLAAAVGDTGLRATFVKGADALLPRPRGLTPRRAEKARFGGLTTREREIAGLIAEGKSNREIAARLVLSERTVGAHIASILNKLSLSSRTQIAVWAVEGGLTSQPN